MTRYGNRLYASPWNASMKIATVLANGIHSLSCRSWSSRPGSLESDRYAIRNVTAVIAGIGHSTIRFSRPNHFSKMRWLTKGVARDTAATPVASNMMERFAQLIARRCSSSVVLMISQVEPSNA